MIGDEVVAGSFEVAQVDFSFSTLQQKLHQRELSADGVCIADASNLVGVLELLTNPAGFEAVVA